MYLLREIKEKNLVKGHPNFPVVVDSPLAVEATKIYFSDLTEYYDAEMLALIERGINVLEFPGLQVSVTSQDSMAINNDKRPKVILSASGMCEAGRIRHHLKHNLWRTDSTVLFVGYQAEGTMGRQLQDGKPVVKLFGESIQVHARIATMDGISGHADQQIMLDWLANLQNTPQVFVNHGNDTVCDEFAQVITDRLGFPARAPYNGAIYDPITGQCLAEGNKERLVKADAKTRRNQSVFDRLMNAIKRLTAVAEKCKGFSNKDLAKFADQVNQLADKWDQ